jgi:hypothetical protein
MYPRPTRLTSRLLAASLFVLAGASVSRAQDAPAAAPEVTLAYKYQTGNLQKFRLDSKSDLTISPEGAAGLGPIPVTAKLQAVYTEKVAGTNQGTGTLLVTLGSMLVDTNALGMSNIVKVQNGKVTTTVNGQPAPAGSGGDMIKGLASNKPITLKRDARGGVTDANGSAAMVTGGIGMTIAQMPDHPVKVGDSWDVAQKIRASVPGTPGGQAAPEIEVHFTHTLKDLVTKGGKQFAIIESTGSGSTPADAPGPAVNQNVTGTTRFDVARGAVASGQYNMDLSMKLATPGLPAGAPSQGAPSSIKVDGMIVMTLAEVPAAPAAAKKAPAKKRARKR